jgi:hypothetical protein
LIASTRCATAHWKPRVGAGFDRDGQVCVSMGGDMVVTASLRVVAATLTKQPGGGGGHVCRPSRRARQSSGRPKPPLRKYFPISLARQSFSSPLGRLYYVLLYLCGASAQGPQENPLRDGRSVTRQLPKGRCKQISVVTSPATE